MASLQIPFSTPSTLDVTIRFSASIPDLPLSIPNPSNATIATLKQEIRKHLPPDLSDRRIRLIHAGKSLFDSASLASSLTQRTHSRTPSRSRSSTPVPFTDPGPSSSRTYIHCSISDTQLSVADLAAEAALAQQSTSSTTNPQPHPTQQDAPPPLPQPLGFDRLLSTGFTAPEIASLRLQFRALHAHTTLPSDMPSPTTLLRMEDAWLDNSTAVNNPDGSAAAGVVGIGDDENAGALDDLIWGSAMGFLWPVGCACWGVREEGVWSRRRKMAVLVGVLVNIGMGFVRWMR